MNDLERILSLAGVKYQSPVEEQTPAVEREYKEGAGADICDHCGCDINNPAQGCTCDHDVEESSCGSKKKHKNEDTVSDESLEEGYGDTIMFKGKEIDTDTIEYDMQDFDDLIFVLEDGVKYTDGTPVADEDYDALHEEYDLIEWVRIDYMDRVAPQYEGEDDMEEGNEFSGKRQDAIDAGEDEFEVDGKKYKVTKEADDADYSKDNLELCDDCDMPKDECECDHTNESLEVVEESPTIDTTQLITLLKHSGISEEAINARLAKLEEEFGNTPEGVGETEPTVHGSEDNYNFAQAVNLSLKRYLDAQDMKVSVTESHTVEGLKAKYQASKNK